MNGLEKDTDQPKNVRDSLYGTLIPELKHHLETFRAGNIRSKFSAWKDITSDHEILQTVSGLKVEIEEDGFLPLPPRRGLNGPKSGVICSETASLIKKGIILEVDHSPGEVLSPIFTKKKSDGSSRMILNLKKLNKIVPK